MSEHPSPHRHRRFRTGGWLCLLAVSLAGFACTGTSVSILPARAVRTTEATQGPRIEVSINPAAAGMTVQSRAPRQLSDVTFYEVELIKDQGSGAATDYSNSTMATGGRIVGNVFLDGPSSTPVTGTMADAGTSRQFVFTNVVPGIYRIRVRAKSDSTTPGTTVISKPDATFSQADGWEISENTATVTDGSNVVTYSAPDSAKLTVDVGLQDGIGDTVGTTVSVTGGRSGDASRLAPDDAGSPTAIHPYTVSVGGVTSDFVWIPRFTAYQLINATACGSSLVNVGGSALPLNTLPNGYWVGTAPGSGTLGTDYVEETFGGFYAAKYEASHADATAGTQGSSPAPSVRQGVVPWTNLTWDMAAQACRGYHPAADLMGDEEWTALAVYALINDIDVKGNNNNGMDIGGGLAFTDDTSHSGVMRALTGSAATPAQTAHDGTTGGVMDLNGNVAEWTGTISGSTTALAWFVDNVPAGVSFGTSQPFVLSLSPNAVARRYGIPTQTVSPSGTFKGDAVLVPSTATNTKMIRGGKFDSGTGAGLWSVDLTQLRAYAADSVGFRPVLRF